MPPRRVAPPARPRAALLAAARTAARTAALLAALLAASSAAASMAAAAPSERVLVELDRALVIGEVGKRSRSPVHVDAVEAALVEGRLAPPREGSTVRLPDGGERTWRAVAVDEDGWLRDDALAGGWVAWTVRRDAPSVALLDARGHSAVFVDGVPRAGNPYAFEFVRLPVRLEAGETTLLFRVGRGRFRARLLEAPAVAAFGPGDVTRPDLVVGEPLRAEAGIVVLNATSRPLDGLVVRARVEGSAPLDTPLPRIPALSLRKVPVRLAAAPPAPPAPLTPSIPTTPATPSAPGEDAEERTVTVSLTLSPLDGAPLDRTTIDLDVRRPHEPRRVTFRSAIDGSVQYYGLRPAHPRQDGAPAPGLILTAHGAGVEGFGQARAYSPKSWAHVVAPTNRRRFGFDWEDWGRTDALEVLADAERRLQPDPLRRWLTGHSMGGHGTWQLGVTFPDRWAAIAPSAGWRSFWTYAGGERPEPDDAVGEILWSAQAPSDTLALVENLDGLGVYVLHGADDDNVPPSEARAMRDLLAPSHPDFRYHEEPGQGHWWDIDKTRPGADCVDWPPLMDFFSRRARPADPDRVTFVTVDPAVSATAHWVTIEQQVAPRVPSRVAIRRNADARTFEGETANVRRLALDVAGLRGAGPVTVALDGDEIVAPSPLTAAPRASARAMHAARTAGDDHDAHVFAAREETTLHLVREGEGWAVTGSLAPAEKGPHRGGAFKSAWSHRPLLVVGTRGTAEETRWARSRARLDAETWWYRGNGAIDVVDDVAFDPSVEPERSVILYGNADTNAAWRELLGRSPLEVRRGRVRLGDARWRGGDLAVLAVRPRPGSTRALVGVVAATGPTGARVSEVLSTFVSGIHWPDVTVVSADMPSVGESGIVGAAWFGNDWSLQDGTVAHRHHE